MCSPSKSKEVLTRANGYDSAFRKHVTMIMAILSDCEILEFLLLVEGTYTMPRLTDPLKFSRYALMLVSVTSRRTARRGGSLEIAS